jgi:hypothetical protein
VEALGPRERDVDRDRVAVDLPLVGQVMTGTSGSASPSSSVTKSTRPFFER